MNLTEKGRVAFDYARKYFPEGWFSAAELSEKCGEKIAAATLNGIVNRGYMEKMAGTPVKFALVGDIDELENEEVSKVTNQHLIAAGKAKKDEFYTSLEDVNAELIKYKKYFKGKKVLLNCNDTEDSAFWQFFLKNFDAWQLEELVGISYVEGGHGEVITVRTDKDLNGDGFIDENDIMRATLEGEGSFDSKEGKEYLAKCDIVCTNPPFSLFRDFMAVLFESGKKFIVLGNNNAITYQDIFSKIKNVEMWLGYSSNKTMTFRMPDSYESDTLNEKGIKLGKVPAISWYTNLPVLRQEEPIPLTASYYDSANRREEYPTYDNYDAIEVGKVVNIPKDYKGVMGVPITFLSKHCPEQFEIVGVMATTKVSEINMGYPYVNGKKKYARVLIKRK